VETPYESTKHKNISILLTTFKGRKIYFPKFAYTTRRFITVFTRALSLSWVRYIGSTYSHLTLRDHRLPLPFTRIVSSTGKMGPIHSLETSVRNQPTLRNIPEDDRIPSDTFKIDFNTILPSTSRSTGLFLLSGGFLANPLDNFSSFQCVPHTLTTKLILVC
jgi:hypothetical protein